MRYLCGTVPAVVPNSITGLTFEGGKYIRNPLYTSPGLPQFLEGIVIDYTVIN